MSSSASAGSTSSNDDLGVALVALAWALFGIAFIIVALRLWTRAVFLKSRLVLHDWLMVCAIVSEIIHASILTAGQQHGLGRHIESLQGPEISKAGHYIVISESFSITTSYFGRMSFAVFLLSVVGVAAMPQRITLWAVIIGNTVVNILAIAQVYAQCGKDLSALWNPAVKVHAHCQPDYVETYIGYCQAGINSLCDLVLTVLPLTIIWSLKMPRGTKAGLAALLMLSLFALIASIAKAVEIQQLSSGPDFTCMYPSSTHCGLPLIYYRPLRSPPVLRYPRERYRHDRRLSAHAPRPLDQERRRLRPITAAPEFPRHCTGLHAKDDAHRSGLSSSLLVRRRGAYPGIRKRERERGHSQDDRDSDNSQGARCGIEQTFMHYLCCRDKTGNTLAKARPQNLPTKEGDYQLAATGPPHPFSFFSYIPLLYQKYSSSSTKDHECAAWIS